MEMKNRNCLFLIVAVAIAIFVSIMTAPEVEHYFPFLTDPQMDPNDQFYLKTVNGEYVSVCHACAPVDQNLTNRCSANLCIKNDPVRSSIFTYIQHPDGTFSVKTIEGKYWKRCENCFERCPNIMCADGINEKLQPAKFVLIKNGDGTVSIETDTGRLFELQECDQSCGRIVAAQGLGLNKQFVIEKLPPPYQVPTPHRKRTMRFIPPSYAPMIIPFQET